MSFEEEQTGGCLCGDIRYRIESYERAGFCHCSKCRKASGGAVMMWVHVEAPDFGVVTGRPETYAATERGRRAFCGGCGSTLWFEAAEGSFYSVCGGTLDDPEGVEPEVHIHTDSGVDWIRSSESHEGSVTIEV